MADDPRRARWLGAGVILALMLAIAARFELRNNAPTIPTAPEPPRSSAPTSSDTAPAPARAPTLTVEFEGARIHALSSGAGTALAVGDDGVILEYPLGKKWRKRDSPAKVTLRAVAQQLDEAIAVGDRGTILELTAGEWKVATPVTDKTLRAVVYTSYGAVAVGDGGTLVRRDAPEHPWRLEPSGTSADLLGACAGLRDVWLVGRSGAIVMRSGDAWKVHAPVTAATLDAVACDDRAGIAVGEKGTILQRQGDVDWHETPSGAASELYAVAAPMGTRSFLAVGAGGTLVRVSGEATAQQASVTWDFRAVTDGALGTFIGGDRGIVRVR